MSHENYFVPAGQLMLSLPKSNYNLTFHRDGQEIGKLDFNGPEMVFTGDAEESAKVFIDLVAKMFAGRLAEEREKCAKVCDDLRAQTDSSWDCCHESLSDAASAIRAKGQS